MPRIAQVKVWNPEGNTYKWVLAYLANDGKFHLDEYSLMRAANAMKCKADDLTF